MWVGLGRVSFLIYLCLGWWDLTWILPTRSYLGGASCVTGIPSWWEISFMNKMTSEGSINIEKCRARLRDQTLLPIISGLESIRWLETRIIDGADHFLMRRQFEAAWAARVGSLLGARDPENVFIARQQNNNYTNISRAIYNILETANNTPLP